MCKNLGGFLNIKGHNLKNAKCNLVRVMTFNTKLQTAASHWKTFSHNDVSSTPSYEWDSNSQLKLNVRKSLVINWGNIKKNRQYLNKFTWKFVKWFTKIYYHVFFLWTNKITKNVKKLCKNQKNKFKYK